MVTDLPDRESLEELKATNFAGSPLDFSARLQLLKTIVPRGRVLDFGCSWGYAVCQMERLGFEAVGFEISAPRAEAGRKALGVEIISSYQELASLPPHSFDAIFTAHVLEHLDSLKEVFALFYRLLKPGGALIVMVPNCGGLQARKQGIRYGATINEKHVNAFTREFFDRSLPAFGFDVTTLSDYDDPIAVRDAIARGERLHTDGEDLTVVAFSTVSG
jgi:2-polyprenyl-3-methyl-5-hydroxy-6-metoxy-1,4-benzoquinol methylase